MKKLRALICVLLCIALCAALIPVSAKESKVLTVPGDSVCSAPRGAPRGALQALLALHGE